MGKYGPSYMDDIESRKERIGWSYTDFDSTLNYYNLSRLPDYENGAEPYLAYIFMSKPMLNVLVPNRGRSIGADENASANYYAMQQNAMSAAFTSDSYGQNMLNAISAYSSNAWLPIITTKAMSYNVGDVELKTVDKGNTYFGHVLKYGKHSEDHKISSTISIDFRNDRYLSILKLMYLWMTYIYNVSKNGSIEPSQINQMNAILDYPVSIYYLVTRRDGRELVYWEKLVGVFPIKAPFSIFSSSDNFIVEDKISVDFAYGIKSDPCDPSILMDINFLSGDGYGTITSKSMAPVYQKSGASVLRNEPVFNERPFVKGDVWATNPYISFKRANDGTMKYYLRWENRGAKLNAYYRNSKGLKTTV